MIAVITCACGGAEEMARSILRQGEYEDWLKMPIAKGKDQSKYVMDSLRSRYQNNDNFKALDAYYPGRSSYIVVIGYDKDNFKWADVARGKIKERLDGEIIVRNFS